MKLPHALAVVCLVAGSSLGGLFEQPQRTPPATSQPSPSTPFLDALTPASRRAVEEAARLFVKDEEGRYWDRQLEQRRKEVREKYAKATAPTQALRNEAVALNLPDVAQREQREKAEAESKPRSSPPSWQKKDEKRRGVASVAVTHAAPLWFELTGSCPWFKEGDALLTEKQIDDFSHTVRPKGLPSGASFFDSDVQGRVIIIDRILPDGSALAGFVPALSLKRDPERLGTLRVVPETFKITGGSFARFWYTQDAEPWLDESGKPWPAWHVYPSADRRSCVSGISAEELARAIVEKKAALSRWRFRVTDDGEVKWERSEMKVVRSAP